MARLQVRVYNDFTSDNLTMHWHGLSQSVAPYSDGTPQASQWPIKAQHYFDYELRPDIGEAGTYFYHSHVGSGHNRPVGELFLVHDSPPPLPIKSPAKQPPSSSTEKTTHLFSPTKPKPPTPWSQPNPSTSRLCGPAIITVQPDQTYRMRTIGGVALSPLVFGIEDHDNLTIIAADSHYTEPASTNMIQIGSGQRYDFLLRTKSADELRRAGRSQFWIQFETRFRQQRNTFYALLVYEGLGNRPTSNSKLDRNDMVPSHPPAQKPVVLPIHTQSWMEYTLQPRTDNNFPPVEQVTRQIVLRSAQLVSPSGSTWTVNNHTWTERHRHEETTNTSSNPSSQISISRPDTPYLVQIYQIHETAIPDYNNAIRYHSGRDPALNVYPARIDEIVDIILLNEPNGRSGGFDTHPWHIHGDHVYDLGSGRGTYNATENERRLKGYRPVLRDTTFLFRDNTTGDDVGMGDAFTSHGWRAWRLRVQNAGYVFIFLSTYSVLVAERSSVDGLKIACGWFIAILCSIWWMACKLSG